MNNMLKEKVIKIFAIVRTNSVSLVIAGIIAILLTILSTWYQMNATQEEIDRAQFERLEKVKENIVSIIEEQIINMDTLDLEILHRIIQSQAKEEGLYIYPTILELTSIVEYNILNSNHISFTKKMKYCNVINQSFSNIESDTIIKFAKYRFNENANRLLQFIEGTNRIEAKKELIILLDNYQTIINTHEGNFSSPAKFAKYFISSAPSSTVLIIGFLLFIVIFISVFFAENESAEHTSFQEKLARIKLYQRELITNDISNKEKEVVVTKINKLLEQLRDMNKNNDNTQES